MFAIGRSLIAVFESAGDISWYRLMADAFNVQIQWRKFARSIHIYGMGSEFFRTVKDNMRIKIHRHQATTRRLCLVSLQFNWATFPITATDICFVFCLIRGCCCAKQDGHMSMAESRMDTFKWAALVYYCVRPAGAVRLATFSADTHTFSDQNGRRLFWWKVCAFQSKRNRNRQTLGGETTERNKYTVFERTNGGSFEKHH